MPAHLSPKLRWASARRSQLATLIESSPRFVRTTSPRHADPVAQVQLRELLEVVRDAVQAEELDLARRIAHRRKGELALAAHQHEAPGHAPDLAGLLAVTQVGERLLQRRRVGVVGELIRRGHRLSFE